MYHIQAHPGYHLNSLLPCNSCKHTDYYLVQLLLQTGYIPAPLPHNPDLHIKHTCVDGMISASKPIPAHRSAHQAHLRRWPSAYRRRCSTRKLSWLTSKATPSASCSSGSLHLANTCHMPGGTSSGHRSLHVGSPAFAVRSMLLLLQAETTCFVSHVRSYRYAHRCAPSKHGSRQQCNGFADQAWQPTTMQWLC